MGKSGVIAWIAATAERRELIRRTVAQCRPGMRLVLAASGAELMRYLLGEDEPLEARDSSGATLVFVDAALPADGALALVRRLKEDPLFRRTPVIVSVEPEWAGDAAAFYHAGANAVMALPTGDDNVCSAVTTSLEFWLDGAKLPPEAFTTRPRQPVGTGRRSWFDYRILDEHRLGVAELSGHITGPDLLASIETFLGDSRLQPEYKILADYTAASEVDIGLGEAREIATALFRFRKRLQSGQTAVVVSDRMHFLISELLIAMGALDRDRIRVFRSIPDAAAWLEIPDRLARIPRTAL